MCSEEAYVGEHTLTKDPSLHRCCAQHKGLVVGDILRAVGRTDVLQWRQRKDGSHPGEAPGLAVALPRGGLAHLFLSCECFPPTAATLRQAHKLHAARPAEELLFGQRDSRCKLTLLRVNKVSAVGRFRGISQDNLFPRSPEHCF
jgi:hypothetical protein